MKTITLTTKPIPINQRYSIQNGRNLLSKRYREAKTALEWEIAGEWRTAPLTGSVCLNILFYFPDKRRRDIDSSLKILLDSMNGIVYEDDSQVDELHVFKHIDTENPRTVILVV